MRALIADDDRMHVRMLSNFLKQKGIESTPVYDGMQTLMFTRRSSPDIIILDISMPAGNGFEVLKKLKSSSLTAHIPVVVLSGTIDSADEPRVLQGGADAFLRKSAGFEELYTVITRILGIATDESKSAAGHEEAHGKP